MKIINKELLNKLVRLWKRTETIKIAAKGKI